MICTLIEFIPVHLRASHEAAGNSGSYPLNGAERAYVDSTSFIPGDLHPRWAEVIEDGIAAADVPEGEPVLMDLPDDAWSECLTPAEAAAYAADRANDQSKDR